MYLCHHTNISVSTHSSAVWHTHSSAVWHTLLKGLRRRRGSHSAALGGSRAAVTMGTVGMESRRSETGLQRRTNPLSVPSSGGSRNRPVQLEQHNSFSLDGSVSWSWSEITRNIPVTTSHLNLPVTWKHMKTHENTCSGAQRVSLSADFFFY